MSAFKRKCYCGEGIHQFQDTCNKPECKERLRVEGSSGKCQDCDIGYYQHAGEGTGYCTVLYACDRCGGEIEKDVS